MRAREQIKGTHFHPFPWIDIAFNAFRSVQFGFQFGVESLAAFRGFPTAAFGNSCHLQNQSNKPGMTNAIVKDSDHTCNYFNTGHYTLAT